MVSSPDLHAEPLYEAFARTSTRAMAEQAVLSLTFLMCTSPAAQQELHRHGVALDRQILKAAVGPAMPTSASPATIGANADRWSGSGNNPTVIISERDTQNSDPWAGRPFRFRSHARP